MVKLTEFISNLNSVGGVSRPNYFTVEIATPPALGRLTNESRQFSLLCEGANLPGINIGVEDRHLPHGYGVTQKMPWGITFTDTNFSFYSDNKGIISHLLTTWTDSIVKYNDENINDDSGFLVSYRNRYATKIIIRHYDQRHQKITEYTLHDAYPGTIYDQPVAWGDMNSVGRILVRMLFTRWTVKYHKLTQNEAVVIGAIDRVVGNSILNGFSDDVERIITDQVRNVASQAITTASARFIENAQQAIPLLSGRSLGNIRF